MINHEPGRPGAADEQVISETRVDHRTQIRIIVRRHRQKHRWLLKPGSALSRAAARGPPAITGRGGFQVVFPKIRFQAGTRSAV